MTDTPHDAAAAEGLVAGPEMDAEIARVVFGDRVHLREGYWRRYISCPHFSAAELVPPYSSDIAAAMKVVAYFTEGPPEHPCLHHFEMVFTAGSSLWRIEIGGRECGRPGRPFVLDQDDWSESLPEAICRAALACTAPSRARPAPDGRVSDAASAQVGDGRSTSQHCGDDGGCDDSRGSGS